MPQAPNNTRDFSALVEVVKHLRGPDGCPWDKEQTHQTLTQYAIEEVFELVEAIDHDNLELMKEELGDVLLQVVLHSEIARQDKRFDISDVIDSIASKMIRRHPHVFADVDAKNSDEVMKNWNEIKAQEKKHTPKRLLDVPTNFPALLRSQKIGSKTKKFNFDWQTATQVLEKVDEELTELKQAIASGSQTEQQHELGDLLFSVTQLARHLDFDAEQALRTTNQRFERRFEMMNQMAVDDGKNFSALSSEELEEYWRLVKKKLNA